MAELERWIAVRLLERMNLTVSEEGMALLIRLFESAREGHLCLPIEKLDLLPREIWSDGSLKTPLVVEGNRLYLHRNWSLEKAIAEKIQEIRSRAAPTLFDENIFKVELENERLQPEQRAAIISAFQQSLSIFTGGPGTGKSYTAGCLIRVCAKAAKGNFKVVIAAPTGKAAAHLESTLLSQGEKPPFLQLESMTLHRLLRLVPGKQRFFAEETIDAHLVVVDEASMLDVSLLLHLLSGIGPKTKLLLLGDPDQLPPVEAGSLFTELAQLFGSKLSRSLRMGEGHLYELAQAINRGDTQIPCLEKDFSLGKRNELVEWLCGWIPSPVHAQEPDPKQCLDELKKFRVLCGLRQGPLGIDELNRLIEDRFTPYRGWMALPILIGRNDLRQQLYNGTVGVVIRTAGAREGIAYFADGEKVRSLPEGALPAHEVGFCLSVHKSQGSEFEEVLALFPPGSERFGREALYTAVTRAKKKATLVMDQKTLSAALSAPSKKRSGLAERMG